MRSIPTILLLIASLAAGAMCAHLEESAEVEARLWAHPVAIERPWQGVPQAPAWSHPAVPLDPGTTGSWNSDLTGSYGGWSDDFGYVCTDSGCATY
jgi:hypothetical protein